MLVRVTGAGFACPITGTTGWRRFSRVLYNFVIVSMRPRCITRTPGLNAFFSFNSETMIRESSRPRKKSSASPISSPYKTHRNHIEIVCIL